MGVTGGLLSDVLQAFFYPEYFIMNYCAPQHYNVCTITLGAHRILYLKIW